MSCAGADRVSAAEEKGLFSQLLQPADLQAQLDGRQPVSNPGPSWATTNRGRQLFYPPWMEGTWQVEARFVGVSFPQGQGLMGRSVPGVTKASMIMALPDVGAAMDRPLQYRVRYAPSPAEGGGITADRVYNVQQLADAFLGYASVRSAEYDPGNPTRMAVVYATPRKDTRDIKEDVRKAEMFITNRSSESPRDGTFLACEAYRQVSQAQGQGGVGDYAVIARYQALAGPAGQGPPAANSSQQGDAEGGGAALVRSVAVTQRVAAFLTPQDDKFFVSGNKAVALYDYAYTLTRVVE